MLDVIRDPRWGRVDECIGEDPYLVGTIGTAYVRGLQSAGVHATLKHFVGYSASRAGRNHAPVHAGPRELADVFLPPFEMAILDGDAQSVMNSYADIDGVPMAANTGYLTGVLRQKWGFDGIVVADYFAVAFLEVMHPVAADRGEAAALALEAGIDVELPTGDAYLQPLADRIRAGAVDEAFVDRAVLRALAQKEELGLLEDDAFEDEPPTDVDLDSPRHRALARRLAEESVVLLSNDGILPLAGRHRAAREGRGDRPERRPRRVRSRAATPSPTTCSPASGGADRLRDPDGARGAAGEFGAGSPSGVRLARGCAVEDDDGSGFRRRGRCRGAAERRRRRRGRPRRALRARHRRRGQRLGRPGAARGSNASWSRRSSPPARRSSWCC